jgi:hypothetical protein
VIALEVEPVVLRRLKLLKYLQQINRSPEHTLALIRRLETASCRTEDDEVLLRTVRAHMELSADFLAASPVVEPSSLLRDQALPKNDQRALAAGWRLAIQTVQDQLPAASHRGGFDHCVIRDLSLGLEERRQGQWGRGHRGMALGLVFIERQQLLLKGLGKQLVAVLPQEHQELGPADACDDGLFSRRRLDGWMPQGWTHGKPSLWHSKEDERLPCYHLMEKYSTDVLGAG